MEQSELDGLLNDVVKGADPVRRDRAFELLLTFAERIAATRNASHAQSAAQSAVADVWKRIESGSASFQTPEQLLAYLKQVALGKAVNSVRSDERSLGARADSAAGNEGEWAKARSDSAALGMGPGTEIAQRELRGPLAACIAAVPANLRHILADAFAAQAGTLTDSTSASLRLRIQQTSELLQRVLAMFPIQIQSQAIEHLANAKVEYLTKHLLNLERLLTAARQLRPHERLIVEMREAGFPAAVIGEKLAMTDNNVRVIHHRVRAEVLKQPPGEPRAE